jgi:hypothetical protein
MKVYGQEKIHPLLLDCSLVNKSSLRPCLSRDEAGWFCRPLSGFDLYLLTQLTNHSIIVWTLET